MAEFPALPFWTDAYIGDAHHLTDAEHGRYLILLIAMWRSPQCRVPNDDAWLARRFQRPIADVINQLRPIIKEFCQCDGNWITQKRLSIEFDLAKKRSLRQSDRAKSRWQNEKSNAPGYAGSMRGCNASTSTSTTIKEDKKDSYTLANGMKIPVNGNGHTKAEKKDTGYFEKFWTLYPRKEGKGGARAAFEKAGRAADPVKIIAALQQQLPELEKREPKYRPQAATWLNQSRWEDDPPPSMPAPRFSIPR